MGWWWEVTTKWVNWGCGVNTEREGKSISDPLTSADWYSVISESAAAAGGYAAAASARKHGKAGGTISVASMETILFFPLRQSRSQPRSLKAEGVTW